MRIASLLFFFVALASIPTSVTSFDFTNIPLPSAHHQPGQQQTYSSLSQNSNTTSSSTRIPPTPEQQQQQRDSVLYNVSSLGLEDPFAKYSTHLTYDSKVEIGDPHNNQKGSILSILNGTIYPLGSVGSIGAIGWEGDSNDTDIQLEEATRAKAGQGRKIGNGGLSGIWLAFTSKDAITGGYTVNNETLTTSNNLVYQNLTFLSNFTMHQDGTFAFTFSFAMLPNQDGKLPQIEGPHCTEKPDKKEGQALIMTCTGKNKKK